MRLTKKKLCLKVDEQEQMLMKEKAVIFGAGEWGRLHITTIETA